MVAAFDFCLHGKGGAAPSIDTAMHGLVDAPHVDHLHPDSGIAIATAADGEALTKECLRRPGRLGAVAPARLPARPRHRRDEGDEPAGGRLRSSAATASPPGARPARRPSGTRLWIIDTAAAYIAEHCPARAVRARRSPASARCRRPSGAPRPPRWRRRSAASPRGPPDGRPLHRLRRGARLPGSPPSTRGWPRSAPPARPLPAHQGQAAGARPARRLRRVEDCRRPGCSELARGRTARTTQAYYDRHADAGLARRSAAPTR